MQRWDLVNKLNSKPPLIIIKLARFSSVHVCVYACVCVFRACSLWKLSVSVIKHHSTVTRTHRLPGTIFSLPFFPTVFGSFRSHWQGSRGENICVSWLCLELVWHPTHGTSGGALCQVLDLNIMQRNTVGTIRKTKTMPWHWTFSENASSEG